MGMIGDRGSIGGNVGGGGLWLLKWVMPGWWCPCMVRIAAAGALFSTNVDGGGCLVGVRDVECASLRGAAVSFCVVITISAGCEGMGTLLLSLTVDGAVEHIRGFIPGRRTNKV